MYAVTLIGLRVVQKVSAQAGQSGAVNITSVESTVQDDGFYELKGRKRRVSDDTL
jgi:hypothetical protein